ncbi:MAG: hypothetical protein GY724_28750 [Actinomycetia bacterium]|nr:hypothetical protein [Actinomycetes bacterium]MCP5034282.1 hypothetical protein [Actinomycetes bacterium]
MSTTVNTIVALGILAGLSWYLYRPAVQNSTRYQALVVPLANIMDVGFLVLSPVIVVLVGFDAPYFMLAICLMAIATGFVISYNIRNYEPLIGSDDRIHGVATWARWALFAASIVNIGYYAQLLIALVLLPFEAYTEDRTTVIAVIVLALLAVIGYSYGLSSLSRLGDRTTAFNISAIVAVVAAFIVFNIQEVLGGRWDVPDYNPPNEPGDLGKLLGFFAIVQGFEASRYIGARFSSELRISTMRMAQIISSAVFVTLLASVLILFVQVRPEPDATAIFVVSSEASAVLPFIILLAAVGSQLSAIVNATVSRSDLLLEATVGLERKYTFPILLIPAMAVVAFTNVTAAVSLASRVFAAFFLLQAVIASVLARRAGSTHAVVGFSLVGLMMAIIMIFSISV